MFITVNIESAVGAQVILLKPRFKAVDVKVMSAPEKEHLVAFHVRLQADSTHPVGVLLDNRLDRDLLEYLLPYSELLLDLLVHCLVIELFKGSDIHAIDWGLGSGIAVLVLAVVGEDSLPFVVPVDEVQVVLA
jgi:hypothetical protein